jgi:hypothetical protein
MVIYESPGYLEVRFIEGKNYIVFVWEDFSIPLADIKRAHELALAFAVQRGCLRFVAECSRARDSLLPEVIVWWRSVWMPKLAAAGLRRIVTVQRRSTLAALSNRDWQRDEGSGIEMLNVDSISDAETALL